MGCGNCGSGSTPSGCQSNGSCGTNSCNRMNAYDWLQNLPIADEQCRVVEVSFSQGARKDFYRNPSPQPYERGEWIAVEGVSGFDVGQVQLTGEIVRMQLKKRGVKEHAPDMRRILRHASDRDLELYRTAKDREPDAVIRSRAIARQLNLNMKVSGVEFQADGKKATFFYIADDRVDFRELIKIYASDFKVKVEMRQIGARQEAGKVGGIGSCGRELCCATWLTDFKSVNTAAARYQNLSINQTKLSGQCGRLKCCLNYELDTYIDALQGFPNDADKLRVQRGTAFLVKKDIFRNLMWYTLPDSTRQYPITIERAREIRAMNMANEAPEDLEAVEVESRKPKEVEATFVDVVGQTSLRSLEKGDRKRRDARRREGDGRTDGRKPAGSDARANPSPRNAAPPVDRGPRPPVSDRPRPPRPPRPEREAGSPPPARASAKAPAAPKAPAPPRGEGPRPDGRPPQNRGGANRRPGREGGGDAQPQPRRERPGGVQKRPPEDGAPD